MSKRGLSFVLVLAFLIGVATIVQDVRFDQSLSRERVATDKIERTLGSADVALANLRAAEASYLATGQGPDFWMKRATELSAQIETLLTTVQAETASNEARPHYDAALSALGSLNGIDQKARDAVSHGERFLASDVVFMDAMEANRRLGAEIAAAQEVERATSGARASSLRRWRVASNTGAAILMCGLVFVSWRRQPPQSPVPVTPAADLSPVDLSPVRPVETVTLREEPRPQPSLSLADAADVCVDFARVLDGRDMPPLLQRAAHVLDAKGLVLWVADDHGAILRPSLAHGYSERVLQRLGSLQVDADNVTSLAYRSMETQVLRTPPLGSTSAIAVPLMTPTGCVGVLAAEVRNATNGPDSVSIAKMFAAQLSTLVTPLASSASPRVAPA
jgi:hypothetical protein